METLTGTMLCKLADHYACTGYADLPKQVIEKSRRVLVDFLSEVAVGFKEGQFARIANGYLAEIGGREEATILGMSLRVPAMHAAMAMGIMGHSIELDDGHRWGTSHPAVAIVPAVIAAAERNNNTFEDLLTAIVIGYDVMLRAARAINPSHLKRGFHSTGTCGSLGAAAACARLLGLDNKEMAYAISIGGLQSAGLQEMLHDHPGIKPIQPGKSALAGVLASDLAKRGAKSPRTLFEGQHGWLKAMCFGEYSLDALSGDLGSRWEIMNTYTKLYPTCRHCHATIDLAREARSELECVPDDIDRVEVHSYSLGVAEVGQIFCPATFEEAMFSMPFAVAIAFERGNVTLQDYSPETLNDEKLRSLAKKVNIKIDEKMDAIYPEERGSYMQVVLQDGRSFEKAIPVAKGEPENPVTDKDLLEKLGSMLAPHYPKEFLERLWEICVEKEISDVTYGDIVDHFRRFH